MIQKTLITNNTDELYDYLNELAADEKYLSAGDRILLFSDQNCDPSHLKEQYKLIKGILPDIKIIGTSMPENSVFEEYANPYMDRACQNRSALLRFS